MRMLAHEPNLLSGETKRLKWQHLCKDHIETLLKWRNSDQYVSFCTTRKNLVSLDELEEELIRDFNNDRYAQFIFFRKKDHTPVGTIYAYNLNLSDGHVFITTYVDTKFNRLGYGVEFFAVIMSYFFEQFSTIHKIYTEVYAYNQHSLTIMKKFGFIEEGCFHEHKLFEGQRYSLYRLAFYRSQFLEKLDFIQKLVIMSPC